MGFIPITIDNYVKLHLKNNPSKNEKDLRKNIKRALADYQKHIKCSCGNDIWVIGSASVGNMCFTCITGEAYPDEDYEIDLAVKKSESIKGRKHIDEIDPSAIHGFFSDDGYKIYTELIKKPSLCISCLNDNNPSEEPLCQMTRYDQRDEKEFRCFAYIKM